MGASTKMTVREAFSLAFGEVPEGATCHVGHHHPQGHWVKAPTIIKLGDVWTLSHKEEWGFYKFSYLAEGMLPSLGDNNPDISDRPAESFLGFFGDKYDKVVQP